MKPHSSANFENVAAANWGPLSETVISGMPWRQKNDFKWLMAFSVVVLLRGAISKNLE